MEELRQVPNDASAKPNAVAFTLLGRQYIVLTTTRLVIYICDHLVLCRACLVYTRKTHMRRLEEEVKSQVEEVTVDNDKPILLDYESEGEGWGSKASRRQMRVVRRAEGEAERRDLGGGGNEGIDKYLD